MLINAEAIKPNLNGPRKIGVLKCPANSTLQWVVKENLGFVIGHWACTNFPILVEFSNSNLTALNEVNYNAQFYR